MMADVLRLYAAFTAALDRELERLQALHGPALTCRVGCTACCQTDLSVGPVEATVLGNALAALPAETQRRLQEGMRTRDARDPACPLLLDQRCATYAARPLICRTQGFPLVWEEENELHEAHCPLNFTRHDGTAWEASACLRIDHVTARLAAADLLWMRAHNRPDTEAAERTPVRRLVLDLDPAGGVR